MIKRRNKNKSKRLAVDVGDILKFVNCKMRTRKLLKLKWTHGSFSTAWGLNLLPVLTWSLIF